MQIFSIGIELSFGTVMVHLLLVTVKIRLVGMLFTGILSFFSIRALFIQFDYIDSLCI